ncbi:hypothetical protein GQ44DRAFT_122550 [Phaeosphaeriaceae sp. PMI808]|nr:hypothetical protein GQ44DRAFT_122550 [Phaeosphaeriaceae sp. PMI808]
MPIGTPTNRGSPSHSHIQVVPRAEDEHIQTYKQEHKELTPTFRSSSLLYPTPRESYSRSAEDQALNSSVPAKTFAEVARQICPKENENKSEHSVPAPVSFAGIVKLQPNRRKVPHQKKAQDSASVDAEVLPSPGHSAPPSFLKNSQNPAHEPATVVREPFPELKPRAAPANHSNTTDHKPATVVRWPFSEPKPRAAPANHSSTTDHKPATVIRWPFPEPKPRAAPANHSNTTEFLVSGESKSSTAATQSVASDPYCGIFERLLDPKHLREKPGEFNGQVVLVGHPNQDVSAHQWSSVSFEWENVGQYNYSQDTIEGPLASDCTKDSKAPGDTLKTFKLAAENREKLIVEKGHSKPQIVNKARPSLTEVLRAAAKSKTRDSTSKGASDYPYRDFVPRQAFHGSPQKETIQSGHLDDPFVVPLATKPSICVQTNNHLPNTKGTLDFQYKYPSGLPTIHTTATTLNNWRTQGETKAPTIFRSGGNAYKGLAQPSFREATPSETSNTLPSLKDQLSARIGPTKRPSVLTQGHVAVPRLGNQQPTARSLYPHMGLTIANPHRKFAHPDTAASARSNVSGLVVPPKGRQLGTISSKLPVSAVLQSSNPDDIRQAQECEIANGPSRQLPTKQCFKGPFFTDMMPTTHDPTVSLSVRVSEEEKLQDWFRNGCRPARQREYARSLAYNAADLERKLSGGEPVGANYIKKFENTGLFVRLYESLSEYYEENRSGNGGSYFNRGWTSAPLHLRGLGPDGNKS